MQEIVGSDHQQTSPSSVQHSFSATQVPDKSSSDEPISAEDDLQYSESNIGPVLLRGLSVYGKRGVLKCGHCRRLKRKVTKIGFWNSSPLVRFYRQGPTVRRLQKQQFEMHPKAAPRSTPPNVWSECLRWSRRTLPPIRHQVDGSSSTGQLAPLWTGKLESRKRVGSRNHHSPFSNSDRPGRRVPVVSGGGHTR